jgi:hypothetical protein
VVSSVYILYIPYVVYVVYILYILYTVLCGEIFPYTTHYYSLLLLLTTAYGPLAVCLITYDISPHIPVPYALCYMP